MPAPPDADAQSTTVGVVAFGLSDHHGDVPCGACVTCACDAAPRVDEEGLCAGCGGVPVAVAVLWGEPHVGPSGELTTEDQATIALLIEEERRFQNGDRPALLPPEGVQRRRDAIRRIATRLLTGSGPTPRELSESALLAAIRSELGPVEDSELWCAWEPGDLRLRSDTSGETLISLPVCETRAGWPTAKGWAAKVEPPHGDAERAAEELLVSKPSKLSSRQYVRHGALNEPPWRLRLEDDRAESGLLTLSEETITSRRPTARTLEVITALDFTEQEAIWLRDALTEALSEESEEASA